MEKPPRPESEEEKKRRQALGIRGYAIENSEYNLADAQEEINAVKDAIQEGRETGKLSKEEIKVLEELLVSHEAVFADYTKFIEETKKEYDVLSKEEEDEKKKE